MFKTTKRRSKAKMYSNGGEFQEFAGEPENHDILCGNCGNSWGDHVSLVAQCPKRRTKSSILHSKRKAV